MRPGGGSQALSLRHRPFCPSPFGYGDGLAPPPRFLGQLGLTGSQTPGDDTQLPDGQKEGGHLLACSGSWLTVAVPASSQHKATTAMPVTSGSSQSGGSVTRVTRQLQ